MQKQDLKAFAAALVTFVLGVSVGIFSDKFFIRALPLAKSEGYIEAMRVSSPDGKLDAVLVEDSGGGALGGIFWYAYVVPRGKAIPRDSAKRLFFADELTKGPSFGVSRI
jgi:hypothetical protein